MNQLMWNEKDILSGRKSLYHTFFRNTWGTSKVGYLVSKDNIFLGSEKSSMQNLLQVDIYF